MLHGRCLENFRPQWKEFPSTPPKYHSSINHLARTGESITHTFPHPCSDIENDAQITLTLLSIGSLSHRLGRARQSLNWAPRKFPRSMGGGGVHGTLLPAISDK